VRSADKGGRKFNQTNYGIDFICVNIFLYELCNCIIMPSLNQQVNV